MALIVSPARYNMFTTSWTLDSRNAPTKPSSMMSMRTLGDGNNAIDRNSNPSWRSQVLKGVEAGTPYTRRFWEVLALPEVSCTTQYPRKTVTSSYSILSLAAARAMPASYSLPSRDDATVRDIALRRFKQRLGSRQDNVSSMAPLAESRELAKMVRQLCDFTGGFLESYRDLRKGRTSKFRKLFYDTWLGYNFGISPMVSDIQRIGESIATYMARQDLSVRVKASASSSGVWSSGAPTSNPNIPVPLGAEMLETNTGAWRLTYRYVGAWNLNLLSAADYSMSDHVGLDLRSIPSTLWELTAFSWMADYFTNIGQYLDDVFYEPPGSLKYMSLSKTYEIIFQGYQTYRLVPGNPNAVDLTGVTPASPSFRFFEYQRSVQSVLPHVGLRWKTQHEMGAYSIPKILNLVSILRP